MKNCNICGKRKQLTEFRVNRRTKDGLQSKCSQCAREIDARYRQKNKDKLSIKYKEWNSRRIANGSHAKYMGEYNRRNRVAYNLRKRFQKALKGNYKSGSAIKDLGCSIEELKKYIENLFQLGMSWENYGEWQIDHIVPLSRVDLTDREQLKKVCHYTNLQPLWKSDNCSKGNKCSEELGPRPVTERGTRSLVNAKIT